METPKRIRAKRAIIELSDTDHKELKKRAANRGETVRQYIYDSIALRMDLESKGRIVTKKKQLID